MTQALFIAYKTPEPGEELINGCREVLVNLDSTSTDAAVKAAAAGVVNAAYGVDICPATYFDTVSQVGDLSGGPLNANKKGYAINSQDVPKAGTAP